MTRNERKLLRFAVAIKGAGHEDLDQISGQIGLPQKKILATLPTIDRDFRKTGPKPKYVESVRALYLANPNVTTREITEKIKCHRKTAWQILKRIKMETPVPNNGTV